MPDKDNIREVWSDNELDGAMAVLYPEVAVDKDAQRKARAQLMRAAGADEPYVEIKAPVSIESGPRRRRRAVPLAVAAATVAVVAAGAMVFTQTSSPDVVAPAQNVTALPRPPATSGSQHAPMPAMPAQPQNSLNSLAGRVTDELAPDQYRYLATHGWRRVDTQGQSGKKYAYLLEYRSDTWIPADRAQTWMVRSRLVGGPQWLIGTEAAARADGAIIDTHEVVPTEELTARCGHFKLENEPCDARTMAELRTASGYKPIPADSRELYEWQARESATHADPPLQFFRQLTPLLHPRFSAPVRRAALEALSRHPYLTVVNTTTKDNRPAVSVSINYADEQLKEEILLDPATAQVIGSRTTALKDVDGAKAGEHFSDELTTTALVSTLGAPPNR